MSQLVRSTRCRTSENRSYRWIAVVTIFAMLGFAGFALAASSNNQGAKIAPISQDTKAAKASALMIVADGEPGQAPGSSSSHPSNSPQAVPANDDCAGAIVIPSGTLPYITPPVDITDATPQVDEAIFTCATVERTIWYSFTPTVSGQYLFSTCNGKAPASTVYDTVISVFDSTGGSCPQAASLNCNDSAACSPALVGAPYTDQGTASAILTAGTTYFIVAGHWADDIANGGIGVVPGFENLSIQVELSPAPANDTCSAPTPLALNRVTNGTTASATNDYRSPASCFTGVGQIASSSNGLDVVFSFNPPATGKYSFRYVQDDSAAALRGQSPVLYLTDNCPAPNPAAAVGGCIKAANRMNDQLTGNGNRSEEIDCVSLTAGTPYYLFFDDRFTANAGGPLGVEVTECHQETEPNDDIASANAIPGCFTTGSSNPLGDVDFFSLGTPPAGSKIFAAIDAVASNTSDYELRITNTTDTLGYDDNDGTSQIGSNAPVIGGVIADGNPLYVRVNQGSSAAVLAEPYHLYTRVETGVAQNEVDTPSNASYYFGNVITGGGFVKGVHATATDQDCFRFVAHEGDNIALFSDNNPTRVGGAIVNTWPILRDLLLGPPTATRFTGQVLRNLVAPSPGTLTGVTPSVTSEFWDYRARYTGTYMACYYPDAPAAGYPLAYQGSISLNCGAIPDPTTSVTDIAVTKTGPAGPVNTGDFFDYTITLTNTSATDIAVDVNLVDTLPAELVFLGLTVNDGFNGNNIGCIDLPTPGTADAPVDCKAFSIAPGASVTYTLSVQVANCIGAGVNVVNTATITSLTTDSNPANDSATWSVTTSETGSCQDLLCDANGCASNGCTINDRCESGVCVSDALNCDDNSLCTDDSCDPFAAPGSNCINDSRLLGDLCNDGNACTGDACDPLLFCVFPPVAAGATCDDFLNCTTPDACDGLGNCIGRSVCDDGLPCTDDFGDEANSCACTNDPSFPGTFCDDLNACTLGTTCDGTGPTVVSCTGGSALNCDDNNPCTTDSCNPATGCEHTNNTDACDDGNACTTGDTCGGGTCNPGAAVVCSDGVYCTDDSCNPATGLCEYTNNTLACDDLNACTSGDTCGGGTCQGSEIACDDSNDCTTNTCNPATGCEYINNTNNCDDGNACTIGDVCSGGVCVSGSPFVCPVEDQCHTQGVCNPSTGNCSSPIKPDGTTCDDGSLCNTGETCQQGVCSPAYYGLNQPKPRSAGYYKQLCKKAEQGQVPYHGDQITDADAVCVANLTATFNFTTAAQLCAVEHDSDNHSGRDKECQKADQELIATALNICRGRVCESQNLDSKCSGNNFTTVAASFSDADSILVAAFPTKDACKGAACELKEINNGKALRMNSLVLSLEVGKVRLSWLSPEFDDGTGAPNKYEIWRRPLNSSSTYTKIGTTTGLTFLDTASGTGMWEYEVTPDIP